MDWEAWLAAGWLAAVVLFAVLWALRARQARRTGWRDD